MCVVSHFSRVQLCAPPWTVACQAPLSMVFSRQEYWNGLPRPSAEDLPDSGTELKSPIVPAWKADSLSLSHQGSPFCIWLTSLTLALNHCMQILFANLRELHGSFTEISELC